MRLRNRFVIGTTLAVLITLTAAVFCNKTQAFRPTAVEYHFGMVGITRTQTLRFNVLNLGRETMSLSINFFTSDGRTIKRSVERVEPDQAVFIDFTPTSVDDGAGRLQIHAWFEYQTGGGARLIPTLEVFDNETGRSQLVLRSCGDGSV